MLLYEGRVIHRSRDEWGAIDVVDGAGTRSLHFDSPPKQSSMLLQDPYALLLDYTRAMITALLFNPEPARVLIVGLGGGSLAKFYYHHFPDCDVEAVELRPKVVRVARSYFCLPDDARLVVHIQDAAGFVTERAAGSADHYDHVLIDAFDAVGLASEAVEAEFYLACRRLLAAGGVLVANLWSGDRRRLAQALRAVQVAFPNRPLVLEVPDRGNRVVIAPARPVSDELRRTRALRLGARLGIGLALYNTRLRPLQPPRRLRHLLARAAVLIPQKKSPE